MFEKAMEGDILDRLNGRYPVGPMLPNGEPEFGWRQHDISQHPPIQAEAAREIAKLRGMIEMLDIMIEERDAKQKAMETINLQLMGELDDCRRQFRELTVVALEAQDIARHAQERLESEKQSYLADIKALGSAAKLAIAERDELHAELERRGAYEAERNELNEGG